MLEDSSSPVQPSYSLARLRQHTAQHQPTSSHTSSDESGSLLEQRSSGVGSEGSSGSSSSRGMLPGLAKRRRLPAAATPLLGQCNPCFDYLLY